MSGYSVTATYKKKAGKLQIIDNDKTCIWTESSAEQPTITFSVATINKMQASAATSSDVKLKVILSNEADSSQSTSYVFSFAARDNLDETKTILQNLVKKVASGGKTDEVSSPAPNGSNNNINSSQQPTPAPAETKEGFADLDSRTLLQDHELQQRLLKENKELMRTFQEAVMQGNLPASDFWSTRVHLLRAYAFSAAQKRGAYNVLSTIKPTTGSDNQVNVSLTREKIHDIFEQYPIVRQAYNENVPKLSESEFWSRFLTSRLFRKLRGTKITGNDPIDGLFDKYLAVYENSTKRKERDEEDGEMDINNNVSIPQYLDIEGNEENDSQRLGNRPDITMQPGKGGMDSVSLIRSMNSLSKQMLNAREPVEKAEATTPTGGENNSSPNYDELDNELKLTDLDDSRNMAPTIDLKLKQMNNLGIQETDDMTNGNAEVNNREKYPELITNMKNSLDGTFNLSDVSGEYNTEDIQSAERQICDTINLRSREANSTLTSDEKWDGDSKLLDQMQMSHATSMEFLRHFWIHFLSGDPAQAGAISKLVAALKKSIERIDAVAAMGTDDESKAKIKRAFDPLLKSINLALQRYDEALQSAEKV